MSQIIKSFTGVLMILFLMVSAIGMLDAFIQVMHAQNIHAAMVDELENSDYAVSILKRCFRTAQKADYELEVRLYSDTEPTLVCSSYDEVPEATLHVQMAKVTLQYDFRIPFFHIEIPQKSIGYAR